MVQLIYKQSEVNLMSHPVNDEILETLYEEVVAAWIADLTPFYEWLGRPLTEDDLYTEGVESEVMRRFEARG